MKRFLLITMCVLLLCAFPLTATAEENSIYENAGELYEAWVTGDCVPDYITAVISTDGGTDNLTFGLVESEAGEAGRQEILGLVRDDDSVTILYQTYSRNELYRIQEEIVDAYFSKDLGLVTAGVSEGANKLILEVKTDYAENPDTLAMMEQVTEQYGDMVFFRFTDSEIRFVTGTQPVTAPQFLVLTQPRDRAMLPFFAFALCFLAAFFLVQMMRRRQFLAAAHGAAVIKDAKPFGRREIEEAIRKAEPLPSPRLHDRVMRSIRDSENNNP